MGVQIEGNKGGKKDGVKLRRVERKMENREINVEEDVNE